MSSHRIFTIISKSSLKFKELDVFWCKLRSSITTIPLDVDNVACAIMLLLVDNVACVSFYSIFHFMFKKYLYGLGGCCSWNITSPVPKII